jgi:hypothetical protein
LRWKDAILARNDKRLAQKDIEVPCNDTSMAEKTIRDKAGKI